MMKFLLDNGLVLNIDSCQYYLVSCLDYEIYEIFDELFVKQCFEQLDLIEVINTVKLSSVDYLCRHHFGLIYNFFYTKEGGLMRNIEEVNILLSGIQEDNKSDLIRHWNQERSNVWADLNRTLDNGDSTPTIRDMPRVLSKDVIS